MILHPYVINAFIDNSKFDWASFDDDVRTATRMLDNVVELSNLPLPALTKQLNLKRRHGLGFTGLGSTFNMLRMRYGSQKSIEFADRLMHTIAKISLEENIALAKEKGCAPIFDKQEHRVAVIESKYLWRLLNSLDNTEDLMSDILKYGLRFSHATSIAPTGTMSLTWGNNCSNGLEPSFANSYMRNIRQPGKKTKVQEEVMSYEFHLWKETMGDEPLPKWWAITDDLSVDDHINIQAAVQKWTDAACSKTINIPTNYPFEDFKSTYFKGWEAGLKGVTTFRFNPEVFTGVLVRKEDLEKTKYVFITEDNSEVTVSGSDDIMYDGELHNAANLFDALKEGLYGDM
jgi:ribonucleoside-diphosphate reductase alpha chain